MGKASLPSTQVKTARSSVCVAQNAPTYLSWLQKQLLKSVRETVWSIRKTYMHFRKKLVQFEPKNMPFFLGRQKQKLFSTF